MESSNPVQNCEWQPALSSYLALILHRGHLHNSEAFNYGVETQEAYKRGALSKDLVEEQKKVQEADLLIFQGWMDRVLVRGFAYDLSKVFDDGLLQGKLSLFSFTTGGSKDKYATRGDIRCLLWPMQVQYMNYWLLFALILLFQLFINNCFSDFFNTKHNKK
uniref:N-ribosyldihydronicotinamide:quinone reductase 2 n=1 Tax=Junco hyemalis TaxID=40217 RepID=A0A8C5IBE5_JUNHY